MRRAALLAALTLAPAARADVAPAEIDPITSKHIEKVNDENLADVYACYEKELKVQPDAKGKVHLRVVWGPGGVVKSVEVHQEGKFKRKALEACVIAAAWYWKAVTETSDNSDFGATVVLPKAAPAK